MAAPALLLGLPAWLWKMAAGMYAAHLGLQGFEAYGRYGLGKRQIAAGIRGQEIQAGMGEREEERYDKIMKQLLGISKEKTKKEQETELLRVLEAGRTRQTGLVMAMMQSMINRPSARFTTYGGPPTSMMGVLR